VEVDAAAMVVDQRPDAVRQQRLGCRPGGVADGRGPDRSGIGFDKKVSNMRKAHKNAVLHAIKFCDGGTARFRPAIERLAID
jgi:hypothetical protein